MVGLICVTAAILAFAGCLGPLSGPSVSGAEAEDRALTAEETYLSSRLANASCLDSWGVGSGTVVESATVHNRTSDAVYVNVTHPYWTTEVVRNTGADSDAPVTVEHHADGVSEAIYRVTADETNRVRGFTLTPC